MKIGKTMFPLALMTLMVNASEQVETLKPSSEEVIEKTSIITSVNQMTPNHAKATYKLAKQLTTNTSIPQTDELIRFSEKVSSTEKKIADESIKICKEIISYDISDTRAAVYEFFSKFDDLENFKSRMYIDALRGESKDILNIVENSHHKEFVILTPELVLAEEPELWLLDHKSLCISKVKAEKEGDKHD